MSEASLLGKGFLFTFFLCWLGGCAVGLFALIELFLCQTGYFAAFIVLYYSYRFIFPKKRWPLARDFSISWCTNYSYFKRQKIVFDSEASPMKENSKTLICCHPHGILCCGWTIMANHAVLSKSKFQWLVAEMLNFIPIVSDVMTWTSGGPATKSNMLSSMKKDENLGLLPGGFEEATIFQKGQHRVFIKNRKGFIKYALQYGYILYPTYVFGEEETYKTVDFALQWRLWLNKYKIPSVLFYGMWYCFFLPFSNVDMTIVIGNPMPLPTILSPTEKDIEKYHALYIQALTQVFEKHKKQYASDPTAKLEIL